MISGGDLRGNIRGDLIDLRFQMYKIRCQRKVKRDGNLVTIQVQEPS